MFGTAPTSGAGEPVGTFLVEYSGITNFSTGDDFLNVIRVDDPLDPVSPTFTQQFVVLGDIDDVTGMPLLPDAPQPITTTRIEVNDRRALNAVWRNNSLWASTQVFPHTGGDAGQVTAHWFEVDTLTLNALTLPDQGDVGGNDIDAGAYTYMPSVMVDQNDSMAIGFALSGPSTYAGAYYTCRTTADPPGTVQSTGVLALGLDWYVRTFGSGRNRWGDYSGMALDPTNETVFWVYNEYAMTRGTIIPPEDGRWATQYGAFSCPSPIPTATPTNTATSTATETPTPTSTPTDTPTPTTTATNTPTPTSTVTDTPTPTPTETPIPLLTETPTPTSTATETLTPTLTPTVGPLIPRVYLPAIIKKAP
jgi:hypothetical protein